MKKRSIEQNFKEDVEYRLYRLRHLARKYFWALVSDDGNNLEFKNSEAAVLKINYRDLDIETSLTHPKSGSTVMIRKGDFTHRIIESIFRNPRAHMPKKIKSHYLKREPVNKSILE